MVKKVTKNNYRKFYKEYYGIEFGEEFQVHHIDKNRYNNNIDNLLLLPTEMHKQFHLLDGIVDSQSISLFDICTKSYYKELLNTIDFNVLRKCINEWYSFKKTIDHDLYFESYNKKNISQNYQLYIDTYHEKN